MMMTENRTMRIQDSRYVATIAPIMAPMHVVISSIRPRRTLESPLSTSTVDAPTDPAMIPVRLMATAWVALSATPDSSSMGTNMTPPPSPNSAPKSPEHSPRMTSPSRMISGSMVTRIFGPFKPLSQQPIKTPVRIR